MRYVLRTLTNQATYFAATTPIVPSHSSEVVRFQLPTLPQQEGEVSSFFFRARIADQRMSDLLEESFRQCAEVARNSGSNFYRSFWLLGKAKRRGMLALYAFSRVTDDLGDSEEPVEVKRQQLLNWRRELQSAIDGEPSHGLMPAVCHTIEQFRVNPQDLHDLIDGVEMDLDKFRYETFDELEVYCHRVATSVGKASLAIWGDKNKTSSELAGFCGLALQLTNILRDIQEDFSRGRIYLPQNELQKFGVTEKLIASKSPSDAYLEFMSFQCERAEEYFRKFQPLAENLPAEGRRVLRVMTGVYFQLLQKIKRHPALPLQGWKGLSTAEKLTASLFSLCGWTGIR